MTRVATIQMVSTANVEENLQSAASLIKQAADQDIEFALLPEYFPIISDNERDKLDHKEVYGNGPIQDFLAEQASLHGIWLMGGTIPMDCGEENRVYNTCLLYDPHGNVVARYEKMHLFDVNVDNKGSESYNESHTIAAGNKVSVAETPFAVIGMSVCYDLRFPELYRSMLDHDISLITVPSAFTVTTGKRHWETLLKARAVENLCYVIASNQGGQNTARRATWGHSMIIDPWGDILAELEYGPGVAVADLDFNHVEGLRKSFPVLKHRKLK
ncbi:MAG: putative amidohydrolase [Gammaproteobacteria bacterium]|jgi:predicted amidohydrolase